MAMLVLLEVVGRSRGGGLVRAEMSDDVTRSYEPYYFRREDEIDDRWFYREPRLVVHIDEYAISAIRDYFGRVLPHNGVVLDLMSSWRSHLPEGFPKRKLVGLGLNAAEMAENPQLDEHVVHDLNANQVLPFPDATFDAAMVTVSVQYMIRPVEVFREVNRVLSPDASFHVVYSNRMFPTKAVAIWQELDDAGHGKLVASYFANSGGWEKPELLDLSPRLGFYSDPVYVVAAKKESSGLIVPGR